MYSLPHFKEPDFQKQLAFMKEHPFATVVGMGTDFPVATQIPLIIKEDEKGLFFSGHIMRNTDHHRAFGTHNNALVLFQGPHAFISASWYENKAVAGTWNYLTVQVKGTVTLTGEKGAYESIKEITEEYESSESAAAFNKIPETYIKSMLCAIEGIEIRAESIDHVFKLSQNQTESTQRTIINHLQERNRNQDRAVAEYMQTVMNKR